MMTAAVLSLIALSTLSTLSWNVSSSASASTHVQPAFSIQTRYSGKYGAITITSSPGFVTALSVQVSEAAAPTVINTSLPS